MSIKEIEKLREKVDKDPNSKLYVPLAEEYRKEGMLDEAIEVLQKGLGMQPGYMSARVSLGKIYLEKGLMNEARIEFENVVKLIPDNLYAHKKLAEIYRDTGQKDLAMKAFRTFLKLNPMDEDALNNLRDLEGAHQQPAEKVQEQQPAASENKADAAQEEVPFATMSLTQTPLEKPPAEIEEPGEEIDAFKESLFGLKAEAGEESPDEPSVDAIEAAEMTEDTSKEWSFGEMESVPESEEVEEDTIELAEIPEETSEEWSFGEVESVPESQAAEEEAVGFTEVPEETEEELSFGDMADVLKTEELEAAREEETISEEMFHEESPSEPERSRPVVNTEHLQTANRLISEEKYLGAINVYQQILAENPEDKKTLQRIEELRSLLKLMGKDKEVLVSKLNAFLSAIKKRGDEFFRRS